MAEWWERWTWMPCNVGGSNPTVDKIFCYVHLFRIPLSWNDSVQIKSSMSFIRGYRCIEREKDNFKSRKVKRLKECALALNRVLTKCMSQLILFVLADLSCETHNESGNYKWKKIATRGTRSHYPRLRILRWIHLYIHVPTMYSKIAIKIEP